MIRLALYQTADGYWQGLEVQGHAGLSAKGMDVLCASVSVLTENLEAGLRVLLKRRLEVEKEAGYHTIKIHPDDINSESQLLFSSYFLGMSVLAKEYPKYIQIQQES